MSALRADAARSRARILQVAKTHRERPLRLNDIAREAGVGVGTAYRHFPTVHALIEALTLETVERLLAVSRAAIATEDAAAAFETCLLAAVELQLEDDGLQIVLLADHDESEVLTTAKRELLANMTDVLRRAQAQGVVRGDLGPEQVMHLICGIEHAIRLGDAADRVLMLSVLLAGVQPTQR